MLLIVSGCFGNKINNKDSVNVLDDTLAIAFEEWKKDSLGCLGLRNKHILEIAKYVQANEDSIRQEDLIKLLGEPNVISENIVILQDEKGEFTVKKKVVNLKYNLNMICEDGVPKLLCDHEYAIFKIFKEDGSFLWISGSI